MKKAFTLLELIVVVIIIAVMVSIALPIFTMAQEKARTSEAIQVLGAIRDSVLRYRGEKGFWPPAPGGTPVALGLDVKLPAGQGYFIYDQAFVYGEPHPFSLLVTIPRSPGSYSYSLFIKEDGDFVCSSVHPTICSDLGFDPPF